MRQAPKVPLLTTSYYVSYGMLVGCPGDRKREEAEQVRSGERLCFEGKEVGSSLVSLHGLGCHVTYYL